MNTEEIWNILVNQATHGMLILQDDRPVFFNQTLLDMTGYSHEEMQNLTLESALTLLEPGYQDEARQFYLEARDGQPGTRQQIMKFTQNSHIRWAEITIKSITYRGKPAVYVTTTNITDRHEMELRLQKYRNIISSTTDGISLVNRDYVYEIVNNAYLERAGRRRDEIEGHSVAAVMGETVFREVIKEKLDRCLAGETIQYAEWFDYPQFGKRYIQVIYSPYRDQSDTIIGAIVNTRDITEQKTIEEQLRESEEKYRLIAESTSDGIVIFDGVKEEVIYASPAFDHHRGYPAGSSIGLSTMELYERIHPDDRDEIMKIFTRAYEEKQPPTETLLYTCRVKHREGHYIWKEDHAAFHYGPDGAYERTYIISRDITDRRLRQERELQLQLEQERGKLLRNFIQATSHEFRTPLALISTAMYILEMNPQTEMREKQVHNIKSSVADLTTLLDSMLLMVELNEEETLRPRSLDLHHIVRYIPGNFAAQFNAAQLTLATHYTDDPLPVRGDIDYLQEALSRLIKNAIQFTPPGGTITITARKADHYVYFIISDTGPGIPPEALPHIFEHFYRADSTRTRRGFGLGLPIALKIIELHGGTIHAESEPGQGATFTVILPLN